MSLELPNNRLEFIISQAWAILFAKIVEGTQHINKEASLQLQLAKLMQEIGAAYCIYPNEFFVVELETGLGRKSIDITCSLGNTKAALELKCFRKQSNRAKDLDMYDALKDIQRLDNYDEYEQKYFICIADSSYYAEYKHKGKASSVTTRNGSRYNANTPIVPAWKGQWNVSRDASITLKKELICEWTNINNWYYWFVKR